MSLFSVGAVQNPIKHIPAAEAVSGHIFNMLLQKILPKMTPKGVTFSRHFERSLKHRSLFTPFLIK